MAETRRLSKSIEQCDTCDVGQMMKSLRNYAGFLMEFASNPREREPNKVITYFQRPMLMSNTIEELHIEI